MYKTSPSTRPLTTSHWQNGSGLGSNIWALSWWRIWILRFSLWGPSPKMDQCQSIDFYKSNDICPKGWGCSVFHLWWRVLNSTSFFCDQQHRKTKGGGLATLQTGRPPKPFLLSWGELIIHSGEVDVSCLSDIATVIASIKPKQPSARSHSNPKWKMKLLLRDS